MSNPELIAVRIEPSRLTVDAITFTGIEPRASIAVPADQGSDDEIPAHMALGLYSRNNRTYLAHGLERPPSVAIYASSDAGRTMERVALPDSGGHLVAAFHSDALVVVDRWATRSRATRYWLRDSAGSWKLTQLPEGMHVNAAAISPNGAIYFAGGMASDGNEYDSEALLAVCDGKARLLRPMLDPELRSRIDCDWKAAKSFKSVDAAGEPVAAVAKWGDSGEHCVMVMDTLRWNVLERRLLRPTIRRHPKHGLTVYDCRGTRFRTLDRGRTWLELDLRAAICAALGETRQDSFVIVDVDAIGDFLGVIARPIRERSGDAVLISSDDGSSFSILTTPGKRTYQALSFVPSSSST